MNNDINDKILTKIVMNTVEIFTEFHIEICINY